MADFGITRKSRVVVLTSYQSHWVNDFTQIAMRIRWRYGQTDPPSYRHKHNRAFQHLPQ
jgi:hypothetical protein